MIVTEPRTLKVLDPMKELVDGLLGVECEVTQGEAMQPDEQQKLVVARYLSRQDETRGVVVVDRPFLLYTGAALAMIPKEKADDAMGKAEMPDELVDNGREILNVAAAVFNDAQDIHLRIENLFYTPGVLAPGLAHCITRPRLMAALTFDIPEYGLGHCSMFVR